MPIIHLVPKWRLARNQSIRSNPRSSYGSVVNPAYRSQTGGGERGIGPSEPGPSRLDAEIRPPASRGAGVAASGRSATVRLGRSRFTRIQWLRPWPGPGLPGRVLSVVEVMARTRPEGPLTGGSLGDSECETSRERRSRPAGRHPGPAPFEAGPARMRRRDCAPPFKLRPPRRHLNGGRRAAI